MISPEALEKARAIALDVFHNAVDSDDGSECMDMPVAIDIIATALQAAHDAAVPKLPDDLAGLVAELRDVAALKKEASKFAEWVQDYSNDGHLARAARSFLDKWEGRDG